MAELTPESVRAMLDAVPMVPPTCRLCGRAMSIGESSAHGTTFNCPGGNWRTGRWQAFADAPERTPADEHYARSEHFVPASGTYELAHTARDLAQALLVAWTELALARAVLAAARERGRRAGLLEAALVCERHAADRRAYGAVDSTVVTSHRNAAAIRELLDAPPESGRSKA